MKKYLITIAFFFLAIIDNLVNFICSIFFIYPKLDSAVWFMSSLEANRLKKFAAIRDQGREHEAQKMEDYIKDVRLRYEQDQEISRLKQDRKN